MPRGLWVWQKGCAFAIPVGVSLLTKAASGCRIFSGCTGLFANKLAPTMVRCWLKDRGARHAERPLDLAEGLRLRNTCESELAHESGIWLQDIQRMHCLFASKLVPTTVRWWLRPCARQSPHVLAPAVLPRFCSGQPGRGSRSATESASTRYRVVLPPWWC